MAALRRQPVEQPAPTIPIKKDGKRAEAPQWFKGYDIRWLKKIRNEHPDGNLVEEYENKHGEIL